MEVISSAATAHLYGKRVYQAVDRNGVARNGEMR